MNGITMTKDTFRSLVSVEAKLDAVFDSQLELSLDQRALENRIESIEINTAEKRRTDTIISAVSGAVISLAATVAAWYAYFKGVAK